MIIVEKSREKRNRRGKRHLCAFCAAVLALSAIDRIPEGLQASAFQMDEICQVLPEPAGEGEEVTPDRVEMDSGEPVSDVLLIEGDGETETETETESESETETEMESGSEAGGEEGRNLEGSDIVIEACEEVILPADLADIELGNETESERESEKESETGSEYEAALESEPEIGSEYEALPESEPESESETETEPESEDETALESEPAVESEIESEYETALESERGAESETDSEYEAETKSETEPESEHETELETETDSETESDIEIQSETVMESEPESEQGTEAEMGNETESEMGSEAETAAESEPKSELGTEEESEEESMSGFETQFEPVIQSEPESESESESEIESEFESESEIESESESEIESELESESESESELPDAPHVHTEACLDGEGNVICGQLEEEEQAQVDEVIALIDALPSPENVRELLDAFYGAEGIWEEEPFASGGEESPATGRSDSVEILEESMAASGREESPATGRLDSVEILDENSLASRAEPSSAAISGAQTRVAYAAQPSGIAEPAGVGSSGQAENLGEPDQAETRGESLPASQEEAAPAVPGQEDGPSAALEAGEEDAEADLEEILCRVSEAYEAYNALAAHQQAAVTNAGKLLALAELLGVGSRMVAAEEASQGPDFGGYVTQLAIESIVDGTEPLDSDAGPGNDTALDNKVIRTFDTIKYNVKASFASRDEKATSQSEDVCFEISMFKKITEAVFDTSTMSWLHTGADYQIDYIDGAGKTVLIQKPDGYFYYDKEGDGTFDDRTSINQMVNGSEATDGAGNSTAYQTSTGAIVRQRLRGTMHITNTDTVFDGRQDFPTGIRVRNAEDGSEFTPEFKVYFKENPDNYGAIGSDGGSAIDTGNRITREDYKGKESENVVTVSCAPLFNLNLKGTNEYVNYLGWFDFSSGQEVTDEKLLDYLQTAGRLTENMDKADPSQYAHTGCEALFNALSEEQKSSLANIRYGRMNGIGITASLASQSGAGTGKGYRGCSLPVGDITFDLGLGVTTEVISGSPDLSGYSAILWDYRPNVEFTYDYVYEDSSHSRKWPGELSEGCMGRNLLWNNIPSSQFGIRVAPSAYRGGSAYTPNDQAESSVYDSGYWRLERINGQAADRSTAANADSVYTFQVSQYDFDLDHYLYPNQFLWGSKNEEGLRITDFAFLGGYAQVLFVMPYSVSGTVTIQKNLTLGNLELTNLSGQTLSLSPGAQRGGTVLADNEADSTDNKVTDAVTLYAKGEFTKRNSFNHALAKTHTGPDGCPFLGTEFWGSPNWDESAYAGSGISIIGSAQLTSESDNFIRAVNLLQLFDSRALSVTPKAGSAGASIGTNDVDFNVNFNDDNNQKTYEGHDPSVACLFAADPDYPQGYDTNGEGVVRHMNTVREEDLVYSGRLYWNAEEKRYNLVKIGDQEYACVGVLAEVRNSCFKDYCYLRVPVTVTDDPAFVGESVCTVNTARAWIRPGAMSGVTWLDGEWNQAAGKNELAGYVAVESANAGPEGNGYTCQNENPEDFRKVEYDGEGRYGSGAGGVREGNTLLILGYEAKIQAIDGKKSAEHVSYYDSSETVEWILQNIRTDVGSVQPIKQGAVTELTVSVDLAYGGVAQADQQSLFSLAHGSYTVTADVYETDGEGNLILGEKGEPIRVYEADAQGVMQPKTQTYSIGTDSENPTEVTFLGSYDDENGVTQYKLCTERIYADPDGSGTGVVFHILDAPIGLALPEIHFDMYLGSALADNDSIQATAAITGTGDVRAYSLVEGNISTDTIQISKTAASFLSKDVSIRYGEVGSEVTYTVKYTNDKDATLTLAYFYDNLPYHGDNRGSSFASGDMNLKAVEMQSKKKGTDEDTGDFQASVTVYYTTMEDAPLNRLLFGFNGTESTEDPPDKAAVEAMLEGEVFDVLIQSEAIYREDPDGAYYRQADGTYTTVAPTGDEYPSTRYERNALFKRKHAEDMGWVTGYGTDGSSVYAEGGEAAYQQFLSTVTGLFVKVANMGPNRDLVMKLTMETQGNVGGELYCNNAYNWNGETTGAPIRSNIVQTQIYGRRISGLVWYDRDLDGLRGEGEALISGVECTLFRWDEEKGQYSPCLQDVAGRPIQTAVTGEDGSYRFDSLAEGRYVVAFSGDKLKGYRGATTYRVNGWDDSRSSDAVSLLETKDNAMDTEVSAIPGISGETYPFAIAYTLADDGTVGGVAAHSLEELVAGAVPLANYVERYAHQDLGLVKTYELPLTGGFGKMPYALKSALLFLTAALLLRLRKRMLAGHL